MTGFWLSATLMSLEPAIEQISVQDTPKPVVAVMAWETDGASDASKIAKHAIQAANCRVALFIPIGGF